MSRSARSLAILTVALLSGLPALAASTPAALVQAMQDAISRGDGAAYLALVDLRDPLFSTEHRRFVEDWLARAPNDLRLTLLEVREEGDRATGQLHWAWRTPDGVQRDVTVATQFSRLDGAWRYTGEVFPVSLAGGRILAQQGQEVVAQAIANDLEALRRVVQGALGYEPARLPVLKLYRTGAALSASVQLSLQPVSGWNEPDEAIKLAAPRWPDSRSTIVHELTHAAVFSRFGEGQARIPWWLHEGLAQFVASGTWTEEARATYLRRSLTWHARGELQPWARLADFKSVPESLWTHTYAQGYAFARFAVDRYGMPRLTTFMERLAAGQSIQAASTSAFGTSFDRVDEQWRAWLAERAAQPSS